LAASLPAKPSSSGRKGPGASAQGAYTQDLTLRRDEASRARGQAQHWYAVSIRKGQSIGPYWTGGTKVIKTICAHDPVWHACLLALMVTLTFSVGPLWA